METKKKAATTRKKAATKHNFSSNKKLEKVLNSIKYQLLHISDTKKESMSEIRRYMREFPRQIDYNIAQYGNLLIYYYDVRQMYKKAGYAKSTIDKMSDAKIWQTYKRQVGYVARKLVK